MFIQFVLFENNSKSIWLLMSPCYSIYTEIFEVRRQSLVNVDSINLFSRKENRMNRKTIENLELLINACEGERVRSRKDLNINDAVSIFD